MKILQILLLSYCLLISSISLANQKTSIRLGVLAFGTVNWELVAMQQAQLIDTGHYQLQITKLANPQAAKMALQSGTVDMIVADWIWVSRQRSLGKDYTFYPYSNTTGALVVAQDSPIKSLADLKNKKLAIAGGELDKNSLLLQALMQQQGKADTFASIEKVYGAPPLLSQEILNKRVDALLTYWHYAARMEAEGYRVLMTGADLLHGLGIQEQVPSIGYVFGQTWASQNKAAISAFLANSQSTKNKLCSDTPTWQSIEKLVHAKTAAVNTLIRERYCAGRIQNWGTKEQQAAERIYQYLRAMSQQRLTGKAESISAGSFW